MPFWASWEQNCAKLNFEKTPRKGGGNGGGMSGSFFPGAMLARQMLLLVSWEQSCAKLNYGHGPFEPKWTFQGHFSAHKPRSVGRVAGHNRR